MLLDNIREDDLEIVVGFTAPIGTDLESVIVEFQKSLQLYAYQTETVRLSEMLDVANGASVSNVRTKDYYVEKMNAGDALRADCSSGDIVAALAISRIRSQRKNSTDSVAQTNRKAWLLRTIKHEEEAALLRAVYGDRFLLVGVSQSESGRRERLRNELLDQIPGESAAEISSQIDILIARDDLDASNPMGQRVREAFGRSDYFIDADGGIETAVSRFVGLLFGEPFLTPTKEEFSMHLAFGASLRSADPGRQVGAVVASDSGEIIAIGVNEVPKYGGGEYWAGETVDHREFKNGHDFNKRIMQRAVGELLDVLANADHLSDKLLSMDTAGRISHIRDQPGGREFMKSRIMSLIEFGRVVHAEMSAITQAARSTASVKGATLYATTFPCHMCMKLIISSGIERVVYVDPYSKSLAFDMYPEVLDVAGGPGKKLSIEPFQGVSQRRYVELFSAVNRDRDTYGKFATFSREGARMRLSKPDAAQASEAVEVQIPLAVTRALELSGRA